MANDLDVIVNNPKAVEQITQRVDDWWATLQPFFIENEEIANFYRLLEGKKTQPNTFTRTRAGETLRATEALATSMFRMMTAQDPCYDLVSLNGEQSPQELFNAHLQLRYQDYVLKWRKRLLRAVRGVTLFGTQFVETPWVRYERFGQLLYEGLGFVPRSLLQCAFDPHILYIEETPWMGFVDYFTEDQLLEKADQDPDNWNPMQIQRAVDKYKGSDSNISDRVRQRRSRSGYKDGPQYEVISYYGRLRDIPREDKRLWYIKQINGDMVISASGNPSPTGKIPFLVAKFLEFELEPFGRGTGQLGRIAQKHMDSNREAYMDVSKMSTSNMWLKSRMSGIDSIKLKPLALLEGEDITESGIRPFRPDLSTIDVGLKMEEIFKAEHQGNTGATPGLQATVTDASATESSIAQNEAIRRISVTAEDVADAFVADYQQAKQDYNAEWLETDMFLALPAQKDPVRVNRFNMAKYAATFVKMVTDKDFRPKRIQNLLQLYQVSTSIRNRQNIQVDDLYLLEEIARGLDINPERYIKDENNLPPGSVLNFLAQAKNAATNTSQELGGDIMDQMKNANIPGGKVIDTPVGATLASQ